MNVGELVGIGCTLYVRTDGHTDKQMDCACTGLVVPAVDSFDF